MGGSKNSNKEINERTWKSLQISYQHWMKSSKYSDKIKEKIKSLYYQENRFNKTPEEIYQEIINIEIGECPICNEKIYIGSSCPNIIPSGNVLPDNPTEGQIKHYNFWIEKITKAARERDQTYLIERNKSQKMRESSRLVGLKTGSNNIRKSHEKGTGIKWCDKCKRNTSHIIGVGCLVCHNNSKLMRESVRNRNIENWKNPEYANKIASNLGNYLGKVNFIKENNCCEIHKECNLKYFDRKIDDYICWECYKQSFILNSYNNQFYNIIKKYYSKSFMFSTFRSQDSINWNGAKAAFEQSLVDNDINWFIYIKFYIDEQNNIKPLVVGKSGSLNVNINGSDVSFSMNIDDGPARKFLKENDFQWDKTQILIIACEDEENAYNIENKIALEYQLFQS